MAVAGSELARQRWISLQRTELENFFTRYRNASILLLVLFAQVLGLAVQVKRTSEAGTTRLMRLWVVNAITPIEKGLVDTSQGVRSVWRNYLYLRGVRHENRDLRDQIERMRIEQVRLSEDAAQARRLQALLGFKEQFIGQTRAAQVIGTSGSDQSRVLYIDKGADDGIRPDMAVITPDGIVGKVLRVFRGSSQVLMINDPSSGVGGILEKSRLQGILQGTASGETMLRYIMSDEKVERGERILTSGGDHIFPKGLPIGEVVQANPGGDLFLNIRVRPAANLGRLEEVLVVTEVAESSPAATAEASGPVRAADILAQRLPSVPQKSPAAASSAAGPASTPPTPKPGTAAAVPGAALPGVAKPAGAASTAAAEPGTVAVAPKPATAKPASSVTPAASSTGSTTVNPADKKATTSTAPTAKPPSGMAGTPATQPASTQSPAAAVNTGKPAPSGPSANGSPTGTDSPAAATKPATPKPAAGVNAAQKPKPQATDSATQPVKPSGTSPQTSPAEEGSR